MSDQRSRKRPTVEEMSVGGLHACELLRVGAFPLYGAKIVSNPWRWVYVRQMRVQRFRIQVDFFGRRPSQIIRVSWTRCNFGGMRPWLHCSCGRLVGKLLPDHGEFACRLCFGNPLYACQSTSTGGRKHFAAAKLRLRLDGSASLRDPLPTRPKGMHKATFRRLTAKLKRLEGELSPRIKARNPDYPSLVAAFDK